MDELTHPNASVVRLCTDVWVGAKELWFMRNENISIFHS